MRHPTQRHRPSPQPSPRFAGRGGGLLRTSPQVGSRLFGPLAQPFALGPLAHVSLSGPLAPASAGERDRVRGSTSLLRASAVRVDALLPTTATVDRHRPSPQAWGRPFGPFAQSSAPGPLAPASAPGPLAPRSGERDRVRGCTLPESPSVI